MKHILAITIAGAFTVAGLSVGPSPANAASTHAAQKSHASDVSSAKKKAKHVRTYNGYRYGGYAPSYRRSFAADPSFDPSGRPYRPNVYTPCAIDLGYGRFTSCDR